MFTLSFHKISTWSEAIHVVLTLKLSQHRHKPMILKPGHRWESPREQAKPTLRYASIWRVQFKAIWVSLGQRSHSTSCLHSWSHCAPTGLLVCMTPPQEPRSLIPGDRLLHLTVLPFYPLWTVLHMPGCFDTSSCKTNKGKDGQAFIYVKPSLWHQCLIYGKCSINACWLH